MSARAMYFAMGFIASPMARLTCERVMLAARGGAGIL